MRIIMQQFCYVEKVVTFQIVMATLGVNFTDEELLGIFVNISQYFDPVGIRVNI